MCQHTILVPHSKDPSQPRLINNISLLTDPFNEEMPPTFSQFQKLKLVTEFIDGCYKHTIAGKPPRCETWTRAGTLGEGSFSTVYKENCNQTSAVRAVKQIKKALAKANELAILAQLGSYPDNFVQLSGWFEDQNHIYLAMEYLPAGDLDTFLKEQDLSEDDTKTVTKQILAGLEIMHKEAICHRDLKPGNILIARRTPVWVKIADFGVSKDFGGSTECRTMTGTRYFMAPEVLGLGDTNEDGSEYTTAVDMWSLGCLVYFMFTKRPPFPENWHLNHFLQGKNTFPPSSSIVGQNHIPHPAIEFIAGLLRPLPNDRPRASEAQSHSWLCTFLPSGLPQTEPPIHATRKHGRIRRSRARLEMQQELVSAAGSGKYEAISALLSRGASPIEEDTSGRTPIYAAAKNGHLSAVGLLLEHGAPLGISGSRQDSALHGAAEGGYHLLVEFLLDRGADLAERSHRGDYALHLSAQLGYSRVVNLLLDRGADISARGSDGWTALHCAALNVDTDLVRLLLDRGADIAAETLKFTRRGRLEEFEPGSTALHVAVCEGHLDVTRLLLDKGADLAAKTSVHGEDPLMTAAGMGHVEVLSLLLERGADLTETTHTGYSALHYAAELGCLGAVELLLDRGADISARGSDGLTALQRAIADDHSDVVRLMLDSGAYVATETGVRMDERSSDTPPVFNESQPHSDPSAAPRYGHDAHTLWRLPGYMGVRNDHGLLDCFQDCRGGRSGKLGFKRRGNLLVHLRNVHNHISHK
ncbi:kinase-like domain-containing protein [Morchella snyderi]|nr:kinase-like domain-containing protein [Morchella snyderi]